jgi:branched-chain amino acid transport system permease protein
MKTPYADINYYVGDVSISLVRLLAFVLAVGCTACLYLLLKKTDLGKAIRAASEEAEGSVLTNRRL